MKRLILMLVILMILPFTAFANKVSLSAGPYFRFTDTIEDNHPFGTIELSIVLEDYEWIGANPFFTGGVWNDGDNPMFYIASGGSWYWQYAEKWYLEGNVGLSYKEREDRRMQDGILFYTSGYVGVKSKDLGSVALGLIHHSSGSNIGDLIGNDSFIGGNPNRPAEFIVLRWTGHL